MSQSINGENIKALRIQAALSQDELAEATQLSTRTIQRIENGETEPRGDSLKRIAKALNINVNELTIRSGNKVTNTLLKEDKSKLILLYVSVFGFLIYPFLGIVFPMVLWIFYKDKISGVHETGKKIMKYQLLWCAIILVLYLYFFLMRINHINPVFSNQTAILIIASLYVINAIIILVHLYKLAATKKIG